MNFAEWITYNLQNKGWSLTQLESEINIDDLGHYSSDKLGTSTLSRIMNRRGYYPSANTINKIESVLGSYEDFLVNWHNENRTGHPRICFEEMRDIYTSPCLVAHEFSQCDSCSKFIVNDERYTLGPYPFHYLVISTQKNKLPIAWEPQKPKFETKENKKTQRIKKKEIELCICLDCRNKVDDILKMTYQELIVFLIHSKEEQASEKRRLSYTQTEVAKLLKTTQPQVFKLMNNGVDYVKNFLAKDLHTLCFKRRLLKTTIDNKFKLHELLEQRLHNIVGDEAFRFMQTKFPNLKPSSPKMLPYQLDVIPDYSTDIWQDQRIKTQGVMKVTCDFLVRFLFVAPWTQKQVAVFLIDSDYMENYENKFYYYLDAIGSKFLCLINRQDVNERNVDLCLKQANYFRMHKMKLEPVSFQDVFTADKLLR